MPNWCSNVLIVTGEGADSFYARLRGYADKEGRVTDLFDRFVPMPLPLKGVHNGAITIDGVRYSSWWTQKQEDGTTKEVPVDEATLARWKALYGHSDWYGRAVHNWGTKWDTDVYLGPPVDLNLHFETAWAPPLEFVKKVSLLYPKALFRVVAAEQGMGFAGETLYRNGELLSDTTYEGSFYKEDTDFDDPASYDNLDNLAPPVRHLVEEYGVGLGG